MISLIFYFDFFKIASVKFEYIQNNIYDLWFNIKNNNASSLLFIIYLKGKRNTGNYPNSLVFEGPFQIASFSTHSDKNSLNVLTNTFKNIYHIWLYL